MNTTDKALLTGMTVIVAGAFVWLTAWISDFEERLAATAASIRSINSDLSNINMDVVSVRTDVGRVNDRLTLTQSRCNDMSNKIDTVDDRVDRLEQRIVVPCPAPGHFNWG